ncbi:MAG TPA: histidinol dehydrogenase [Dictyoglomaceae bacterium]|nr:histidinol dehydrogenase [Dictyoglomaceae bacterium]HOL38698.1 histidinol dehydrogenase [Dictyoglomaceae bacterium]HOP94598.1 histidinol dehydrogenase [Dictyoglomaceae bacterium]HPP15553.1 histidinol dehydrogenase [Dictyoglomaceae bacterium]HPU42868.1 histidinol dehydrogenase [Dictyoglomaceae bacterium]
MLNVIIGKEFSASLLEKERENKIREIEKEVEEIVDKVKREKDKALYEFSLKFDGVDLRDIGFKKKVPEVNVSKDLSDAVNIMIERIRKYYFHEIENSWFYNDGEDILGQLVRPVESVLLYVPGGRAVYPSTIAMGVVPAQIAGVKEIYVTTPPTKKEDKSLFYTLKILGVEEIYLLGGAHAISAFAYGTESIPKVDMIIGPGNLYVATAKKKVFGEVNIDGIFGPSEIALWVKDTNVDLKRVVCDFLAQIEHSPYDRGFLVVPNNLVDPICQEIEKEILQAERKEILEGSIKNSYLIVEENEKKVIDILNTIAPEHLEILDPDGEKYLPYIKNAGAIFINHSSIFGDFIAGPSHILPTGGSAKSFSGLCVNTFLKRTSFVKLSKEDQKELSYYGGIIAREEGFYMHEKSLLNYQGGIENGMERDNKK